jgi:hypothetical protein
LENVFLDIHNPDPHFNNEIIYRDFYKSSAFSSVRRCGFPHRYRAINGFQNKLAERLRDRGKYIAPD